ncbi:unnamed protein product [marine sediment metagenome]|uniref:Holin n=1 Tax=marine sediment metagenome TaxID=412755 RepID=X1EHY2_9ZZZZ
MENLNIELTPAMLALVPVVAAILQMIKRLPLPNQIKEFLPGFSMLIAFGLLYYQGVPEPLLAAVMIGLTAAGGYDFFKQKKKSIPLA